MKWRGTASTSRHKTGGMGDVKCGVVEGFGTLENWEKLKEKIVSEKIVSKIENRRKKK